MPLSSIPASILAMPCQIKTKDSVAACGPEESLRWSAEGGPKWATKEASERRRAGNFLRRLEE